MWRGLVVCSMHLMIRLCFFFFQAEDGIRDVAVTGVQTCALPIFLVRGGGSDGVVDAALLRRVRGWRCSRRNAARVRLLAFARRGSQDLGPALPALGGRALVGTRRMRCAPATLRAQRLRADDAPGTRQRDPDPLEAQLLTASAAAAPRRVPSSSG